MESVNESKLFEPQTTDTNEAFFHQNLKLLGWRRQFGQINFGAFGVFSTNLSAPIFRPAHFGTVSPFLVHVFH
jgi:hypothetical protein